MLRAWLHRGFGSQVEVDDIVQEAYRISGTFAYLLPRKSADLTAEYRFTRRFSVFVNGRNINEAIDDTVRYGPQTPRERSLNTRLDYRAYWNVGVNGTF